MFSLAGIFRRFWPGYRDRFRQAIPATHVRAAEAILRCRTPEAGMVYWGVQKSLKTVILAPLYLG